MLNPSLLSPKRIQLISWTLLCLMIVLGMAIDLITPSLPAISHQFNISAGLSQNLIALYLFGYAIGNFCSGFLTNAWGRRIMLRIILLTTAVVSMLPVFFPNIEILLLTRLLQGLALGGYSIIMRAIFTDILPAEKLVRQGTLIATMWGLSPIIGPVIGGYFQFYLGWQANFYMLALALFIFFCLVVVIVPETHRNPTCFSIGAIKNSLMQVLRTPIFIGLGIILGVTYSLIIVFQTAGPFLIQVKLGYSPVFFGYCALGLGIVFLLSTFVCRNIIKRFQTDPLLQFSILSATVIALLCLIGAAFSQGLWAIEIISALMFFCSGIIFPLAIGKGMILAQQTSAVAISVMYLLNIMITSVVSFIISLFNAENVLMLTVIYFILLVLCALVYWTMVKGRGLDVDQGLK